MNADPTYQQHSILFIDDELQSQKYFAQIFGKIFKVHLASDGEEGLALFREYRNEIGVVVSDQRMPGMPGSELLGEIAKEKGDVVKILSTAYSDLEAAIDAVNEGGIYRYVTKPWDLPELEVTLRRAMDFFQLKERHRSLAQMKIAGLEQMFHQSRLLACIAIPSLLANSPSAVRAFRDILRLSLDLEDQSPRSNFSKIESLTRKARQQLAGRVQAQLARLLEITGQLPPPDSEGLAHLSKILNNTAPGGDRLPLVTALLLFLQGEGKDADLENLAALLNAYQSGYEIQRGEIGWILQQSNPDPAEAPPFQDLYDLFVDDAFLVTHILGELR